MRCVFNVLAFLFSFGSLFFFDEFCQVESVARKMKIVIFLDAFKRRQIDFLTIQETYLHCSSIGLSKNEHFQHQIVANLYIFDIFAVLETDRLNVRNVKMRRKKVTKHRLDQYMYVGAKKWRARSKN